MSIKIYSWNICFGCMDSTIWKFDTSTKKLAEKCSQNIIDPSRNLNKCTANVIKQLSKYKYDFIGLQEASNWKIIYDELVKTYPEYKYTHHMGGKEHMITIYDSTRFKLDFITVNQFEPGRPFQILFLTEKLTSNKFIVINLHSGHFVGNGRNILIRILSEKVNNSYRHVTDSNLQDLETKAVTDITQYIGSNDFNIMLMGDFNDEGEQYWKGFSPFRDNRLSINTQRVESVIEPPKTCCVGRSDIRVKPNSDHRVGDYILIDTNKMDFIQNNRIPLDPNFYTEAFITSDHLPVYSEINVKHRAPIPMPKPQQLPLPIPIPMPKPSMQLKPGILSKRLRLMLTNKDPNIDKLIDGKWHIGGNVDNDDSLEYPNGRVHNVNGNNYVLVCAKNNPNKIGYINQSYLINVGNTIKLNPIHGRKTLRLRLDSSDPNDPKFKNSVFKGLAIDHTEELIYPNGETYEATDNGKTNRYVLVQKADDGNIFGYVNKEYLTQPASGFLIKYLKYKQKYLELRKASN